MSEQSDDFEEPDDTPDAKVRTAAYAQIIRHVFMAHYRKKATEFVFDREELAEAAKHLKLRRPKNLGDVVYAFRYRRPLPQDILKTQTQGRSWVILGAGDAKYRFRLNRISTITPTKGLLVRKIPDATPQILLMYARDEEQALLARVRYNRLIDTFLGITASSLQNHLRTKIPNYGQIEIDELYVGVDSHGAQYVIPVQAKGGKDKLGAIQTIQDSAFCDERFPKSCKRLVSTQFLDKDVIAMFQLEFDGDEVSIAEERHYRLVPKSEFAADGSDLERYRNSSAR